MITQFSCIWKTGVVALLLLLLTRYTFAMELTVEKTWDDQPLNHDPVIIRLEPLNDSSFVMNVQAPFFNDPADPGGAPGQPFLGLWNYEVVELFLANDADQYVEIEVGPWGQHIVLLLNGVKKTIRHSLPLDFTVIQKTEEEWQGRAIIPADYLPPNVTRVNAYAIHGSDPNRTYEALYPVPKGEHPNPDFHRLEYFRTIDLSEILSKPVTELSTIWQESILSPSE